MDRLNRMLQAAQGMGMGGGAPGGVGQTKSAFISDVMALLSVDYRLLDWDSEQHRSFRELTDGLIGYTELD